MDMGVCLRVCMVMLIFTFGFALRFQTWPVMVLCMTVIGMTLFMRRKHLHARIILVGMGMLMQVFVLYGLGVREILMYLCGMTDVFAMVMWAGVRYDEMHLDGVIGTLIMGMCVILAVWMPTGLVIGTLIVLFGPMIWRHCVTIYIYSIYRRHKRRA